MEAKEKKNGTGTYILHVFRLNEILFTLNDITATVWQWSRQKFYSANVSLNNEDILTGFIFCFFTFKMWMLSICFDCYGWVFVETNLCELCFQIVDDRNLQKLKATHTRRIMWMKLNEATRAFWHKVMSWNSIQKRWH